MSIFGIYFVGGLMREAGWPKQKGIFRKKVYDTTLLDSAIHQMIEWSAALGAGRPILALHVIAEIFRDRDWNNENAPNIERFIQSVKAKDELWCSTGDVAPQDVVRPVRFAQGGSTLDAKALTADQFGLSLEHWFLQGLLWGFANPDAFEKWYQARFELQSAQMDRVLQAGLEIGELPDFQQFLKDCEELVRSYERDIGPLPEIPEPLVVDARALGRLD